MRNRRSITSGAGAALVALTAAVLAASGDRAPESRDPLAAEIERWSQFLTTNASTDEMWAQVKENSGPALARAQEALHEGRRLLALQRFAGPRTYLGAASYLNKFSSDQRKEPAAFETEWARAGSVLREGSNVSAAGALRDVRPAAVRALGEAAVPQVHIYYETSLEYGRNTMPQYGFFYLGIAQAQREFAAFCRTLSVPSAGRAPQLRPLRPELDLLEGELLAAYRPPASIDKHSEFIAASSTLKEARELDTVGLRYGALLRYLQAAQRLALLGASAPSLDPEALSRRLAEWDARLSRGRVDHSLGRLFLEAAQADLWGAAAGASPTTAAAIADDVLPRYFAALEPARPEPSKPVPQTTVTLVRWPYT
jgi:hypothetical protein